MVRSVCHLEVGAQERRYSAQVLSSGYKSEKESWMSAVVAVSIGS